MEVNKLVAAVGSAGLLGITCLPLSAFADMNWHSDSFTYQYGKEFKVDAQTVQTITYEHFSDWSWGDVYFFMDNCHKSRVIPKNKNGPTTPQTSSVVSSFSNTNSVA